MSEDIVVLRGGEAGVVILEKDIILYPNIGLDFLDMFYDNLLTIDKSRECDIIEAYRGEAISFLDYKDGEPIYDRNDDKHFVEKNMKLQINRTPTICKNNIITIVAQRLYDNRTTTKIDPAELDHFIFGYLNCSINITVQLDQTIVQVPNTDNSLLFIINIKKKDN